MAVFANSKINAIVFTLIPLIDHLHLIISFLLLFSLQPRLCFTPSFLTLAPHISRHFPLLRTCPILMSPLIPSTTIPSLSPSPRGSPQLAHWLSLNLLLLLRLLNVELASLLCLSVASLLLAALSVLLASFSSRDCGHPLVQSLAIFPIIQGGFELVVRFGVLAPVGTLRRAFGGRRGPGLNSLACCLRVLGLGRSR